MPQKSIAQQIAELTQKLAQELSFAEPNKDNGLLPINSFIGDMEEFLKGGDAPAPIHYAVSLAREWIDQIFDTTAQFDPESLSKLQEWVTWMEIALENWQSGSALPPKPESWEDDSGSSAASIIPSIRSLVEKLSLELAFTESGKDSGLLPINSFICEIEELLPSANFPSELVAAIGNARSWLNHVFDTTATFDTVTIQRLESWGSWMDAALERCANGSVLPIFPKEWSDSNTNAPVASSSGSSVKGEAQLIASSESAKPAIGMAGATSVASHSAPTGQEPRLDLNLDGDDRDLIVGFISESYEHLQNIEQGVLVLEENPTDAPTLNSIFRAFHTFKGGAGCVNLIPIKDLAHELESLLDAARQHKLEITTDMINVILEGGDTLGQFVAQISDRLNGKNLEIPIQIPTLQLIARTRNLLDGGHDSPPACEPAGQAPVVEKVAKIEEAASVAETSVTAVKETTKTSTKSSVPSQNSPAANSGFVKVDTIKLDALIDLVGELVISESMVAQDPELRNHPSRNLARNLGQLRRITSELQRTAMSLRMVPIRATFQKMTRLVRDLGAKQNKQVQLLLSGEDTELDRNIVEELSDPLVHMIRNAADHGVEKPEDRLAKGKPAMGTINLRAFHKGGNIVIQIEDDGNGLNKERILAKARERGLLKPNETLPEKDIYDLIFAPGFSTAEVVSDISGRGVGMDVVRQNIEKLRGKVEIDTVPGQGTTFTIYLPLTLAIIDGMIVSIGGERYIIPTLSVRESFRPKADMISSIHERGEMVNVRGRLSPLLRLYQYLEQAPKVTDPAEAIIVVVESGQQTRCLMVDELIGKQEVVIKSLGGALKRNNALAGGAVLGDGRVGLILNVDALVRLAGNGGASSASSSPSN